MKPVETNGAILRAILKMFCFSLCLAAFAIWMFGGGGGTFLTKMTASIVMLLVGLSGLFLIRSGDQS